MKIISYTNPKSPIAEAYRSIRTNIEFSNIDKHIKIITITSTQPNEGKSTVISNLAAAFASLENKRVLIIDGDLRNPSVHKMFGVSNLNGITDILLGEKDVDKCLEKTKIKGLDILKVGKVPPNPSEMLQSNKMRNFIEVIKEYYDYVFIDAPPVGVVADASIISQYSDGVILLVGSNETDIDAAKVSKERLENVGANILGVVLNKFESEGSAYGYYGYYYGNEEENKKEKRGLFRKK